MPLLAGSVIAKFAADLSDFKAGIVSAKSSLSTLGSDAKNLTQTVSNSVKGFGDGVAAVGDKMKGLGTGLSIGVTAPLVLMGKQAAESFGQFEQNIQRAGAFVGATTGQLEDFRKAAIAAAKGTEFTFAQTADALGSFVGGEISAEEASQSLGDVIDLAIVAKMKDLQQVADVASTALTVFSKEGITVKNVSDEFAGVASNVTTNTEAFARAFMESAGASRAAGFSFKETTLLMSELVAGGANVDTIGSAINRALVMSQDVGKQAAESLAAVGQSAKGLQKALSGGPITYLEYLKKGFDRAQVSGQGMVYLAHVLGREAAPEFAIALSNDASKLQEVAGWLDNTAGASDGLIKSYRDSLPPLQRIQQTMQEFYTMIGPAITNMLSQVANYVAGLADRFKNLSPQMQQWIVYVGAGAAALGPLLIILGTVLSVLGGLISSFGLLGVAIIGMAVGGGLYIKNLGLNFTELKNAAVNVFNYVRDEGVPIFQMLVNFWSEKLLPVVRLLIEYFRVAGGVIIELLIPQFQMLWQNIQPFLPVLAEFAKLMGITLVVALAGLVTGLAISVVAIVTALRLVIGWFGDWYQAVQDAITGILIFFNDIPVGISNALRGLYTAMVTPFKQAFDAIAGMADRVWEKLQKVSPFHKESPSLVENVQNGVSKIIESYQGLAASLASPMVGVTQQFAAAGGISGAPASGPVVNNLTMYNTVRNDGDVDMIVSKVQDVIGKKGLNQQSGISS